MTTTTAETNTTTDAAAPRKPRPRRRTPGPWWVPPEQIDPVSQALAAQGTRPEEKSGREPDRARPFATGPPPIDLLDAHRVISQAAAAHLLGVSIDTLARMSARGEGPKRLKLSPRRVGYRLADCLGWLKSCEA
jgi:predicted DNA-binding transcriptional regulator AlpA